MPAYVSTYDWRSIMNKKISGGLLAALFFTGLLAVLPGCNTFEGAGKDIEQGGKAIKEEARENKTY